MKFLVTVFKEDDLPKINHLGTIMVDYNHLYDMENRGFKPMHKDIEVSRSIYESIQYAPVMYDSEKMTKFCTDEGIESSYSLGYFEEDDYQEFKNLLNGASFKRGNVIYQEELEEIIENAGGQMDLDDLIETLKKMKK